MVPKLGQGCGYATKRMDSPVLPGCRGARKEANGWTHYGLRQRKRFAANHIRQAYHTSALLWPCLAVLLSPAASAVWPLRGGDARGVDLCYHHRGRSGRSPGWTRLFSFVRPQGCWRTWGNSAGVSRNVFRNAWKTVGRYTREQRKPPAQVSCLPCTCLSGERV